MKLLFLSLITVFFLAAVVWLSLWFKPHRDISGEKVFEEIQVRDLVNEFTTNNEAANRKYLAADGNSKVLIVAGRVNRISVNQDGEKFIILMDEGSKTGVMSTFRKDSGVGLGDVKVGDHIKVKGVITAGNSYDPDLDLYEYAVLVQCELVK